MAVLLVCPVVNGLLPASASAKAKSRPFRRLGHYYHLILRRQQKPAFPRQLTRLPGLERSRDMSPALR
jgi:hypothetical protein